MTARISRHMKSITLNKRIQNYVMKMTITNFYAMTAESQKFNQASGFRLQASGFRLQSSGFRL